MPCRQSFKPAAFACGQCAEPLSQAGLLCGRCLSRPPAFTTTVAGTRYDEHARPLVHALKYRGLTAAAKPMAAAIETQLPRSGRPNALLPVPMHWRRMLTRGANHADSLALALSHRTGIPVDRRMLRKCRHTPPQSQLAAAQRERLSQHAFSIHSRRPYQHVALVDDVMTTGSTARVLAKMLRQHGVAQVDVWVFARAGEPIQGVNNV